MPACMQNLLVEIKCFQLHGIPQAPHPRSILQTRFPAWQWPTDLLSFESRFVGLQHDIAQGVSIIYPEVIVVRSR